LSSRWPPPLQSATAGSRSALQCASSLSPFQAPLIPVCLTLAGTKFAGHSTEIEEYIARWIEVTLDGITGDAAKQMVMFGTDSQYWMNGHHVLLRKASV
jgi:hypothetical protein